MKSTNQLVKEHIVAAYGAASNPNYSFVAKVFNKQPYKEVMTGLSTHFIIEDITEINYDVSFSYVLKKQNEYLLQLSMIAKFFVLFELATGRKMTQVVNEASDSDEEYIFLFLEKNGFIRIDETIMASSTDLVDVESGSKLNVYQALFTTS